MARLGQIPARVITMTTSQQDLYDLLTKAVQCARHMIDDHQYVETYVAWLEDLVATLDYAAGVAKNKWDQDVLK